MPAFTDTFDPDLSVTYKETGERVEVEYVQGGRCEGGRSWDVLQVNGTEQTNYTFVLVDWESQFTALNADGLFVLPSQGLGYPSSYLSLLYTQAFIPSPVFSLYLSNDLYTTQDTELESMLLLGETDIDQYGVNGDMTYIEVEGGGGWRVDLWKVQVGGANREFPGNQTVVFDAGVPYILLPASDYTWFISLLFQAGDCGYSSLIFRCDCTTNFAISDYPVLTLSFPTLSLSLPPHLYFYRVIPTQTSDFCESLILPKTVNSSDATWVLGTVFMRNYYMEFDQLNRRIGLIPAINSHLKSDSSDSSTEWYEITTLILLFVGLFYMVIMALKLCRVSDRPAFPA